MMTELNEYYDSEQNEIVEEKDSNNIARLLCSKSSTTWGAGRIGNTDYYQLAKCSPVHKGDKSLVIVCKLSQCQINNDFHKGEEIFDVA